MARRVSWTNNSSGHLGTYVYRAETLDPQNLPAPVATVDPVAQGETAEWIDNSGEYGCFAVQDFDGQGVGTLSAEVCVVDPWAGVQVGDAVGGGIYAGTHSNGSETWHLVVAKQAGESGYLEWGNYAVTTGATNQDDGKANQTLILTSFDNGSAAAFYHCRDYVDAEGNNDYYLPSRNEIAKVKPLFDMLHPEFSQDNTWLWSSTEFNAYSAYDRNFTMSIDDVDPKTASIRRARPVRRVPV